MNIKSFAALKKNLKVDVSNNKEIKIAILGDTATQLLSQAIKGYGVEMNFNFNIYEADYNQIEMQVFDESSELYKFTPDFIIIYYSSQKLINQFYKHTKNNKELFADTFINKISDIYYTISSKIKSKIILFNFTEISDNVFGNYANKISSSFTYQIRKINYELMNLGQKHKNLFILDLSAIQNTYGRNILFDNSIYINTDLALTIDVLPLIARNITDVISSINGTIKKCLILDLDNTLWGGTIGDDGIENIQIGELGIGKAFSSLQLWIKQLKERGIILAVCSKNNEATAKEPFINHPDMVLKLDDIAVFVANWEPKSENIKYIQSVLNIGFDSMVFLDDNPFERNYVKTVLPDITVPELPEDPALYLEYLYSLNLFETASFSDEDVHRTKQYQEEANRKIAQTGFVSEKDFLSNLEMISIVKQFDKFNIPRIAQLTQRSNQFNLRTIRYTEEDLTMMSESDNYITFSFTLQDKFGDNGLISVIIMQKQNDTLFIDTWIMSCRVLKRGMENFVLNTIATFAKNNGFDKLIGEYIPTNKNSMVANHYSSLGFNENNGKWELETKTYINKETYIKEA